MANQFTDEEMIRLKSTFDIFDTDGNGQITASELMSVLKSLGHNPTAVEILDLIKKVDTNGNGTIEFSEFVAAVAKKFKKTSTEPIVIKASCLFEKECIEIECPPPVRRAAEEDPSFWKVLVPIPKPKQFTEEEMDDLKESFAIFDKDGNGRISTSELTAVMKSLGQNPTDTEILDIIKEVDADGNGTIEFTEFVTVMARTIRDYNCDVEIKDTFNLFDSDGNGVVNAIDLRHVSVNLGENLTDEEIAEMIKQADFDGDGVVNFKDFVKMMCSK
ncbi:uncharacterized protein LOC136031812 isoform X2 [Artemia franciscana]|uniref:uncharacterized protein LOC136031812 isoform X1 n=1 Tax=Artemia franciscana TaxID=6661 RepID=UPI0032DAD401